MWYFCINHCLTLNLYIMKTKQVLFGTITGTVAMFMLGWVIYGIALSGYMEANSNAAVSRPPEQMSFPALILSNLMWALLISLIIDWTNTRSAGGGAKIGAITGALAILGFDLTMYATTTLYSGGVTMLLVDTIGFAVMTCVTGAVAGWVMNKSAAAPATA